MVRRKETKADYIPVHTPGAQCGVCKPWPCPTDGCRGYTHYLDLEHARFCADCGGKS